MIFSRLSYACSINASKEGRVIAFIEDCVGKTVVSVVSEARRYCYKCFDGTLGCIDMAFVDDIVGE